jgi:molybdenum cofactor cytidylyltransferase
MAISIFAGLSRMLNLYPTIPAVILSVCDQPFLTAEVLRALVDRKVQSEKGIVASFYRDTVGTPVLFTYPYLQALLKLTGDEGAKKLLLQYKNDLAVVAFPQGYVDIDRPEDYEGLTAQLPQ